MTDTGVVGLFREPPEGRHYDIVRIIRKLRDGRMI